jgi:hypothetical protein
VNLQAFCGTSERYAIDAPWIRKGFEYATDSAIIVRRPTEAPNTPPEGTKLPIAGKLLEENSCHLTDDWPLPEWQQFERADFGLSGRAVVMADQCIGGRNIAGHYALMIYLLGGVRYSAIGKPNDPLYFKAADGTEGVVMPIEKSVHE